MKNIAFTLFAFFLFTDVLTLKAQHTPYIEGELIVMLDHDFEPEIIAKNLSKINGIATGIVFKKQLSSPMKTWLVTFDRFNIDQRVVFAQMKRQSGVALVQYNHYVTMRSVPDDPLYSSQWQYSNDGSNGGVEGADIEAEPAWDITTGGLTVQGDTIVVAVLDNGIDTDHSDWGDNIWVNHAEIPDNGIDDDSNGYIDDYRGWNINSDNDNIEGGFHGTPVAGIIGAQGNNGNGVTGVNWNIKIMIIHNNFNTNEAAVIEAYTYPLVQRQRYNNSNGADGAFVVATNASWGIDQGQPADAPIWCAFYDTLGTYGILNCGATANANFNIDEVGDLPTACPSDYLIAVTNMNNQDIKVTNAGYGLTTIDLGAFGQGTYTLSNGNGYGGFGGTSGATPHVTGAIGLLYSAPCNSLIQLAKSDPAAASLLVKNAILNGAESNESLNGITVTGGRLNLNTALLELLTTCSEGDCLTPYALNTLQLDSTDYLFSWTGVGESLLYNFRIKKVDDPDWTLIENYPYDTISFEQLDWCTEYEFQVQAICNDTSESEFSEPFTFTTDGCCKAPDGLQYEIMSDTSMFFSWNPVLGVDLYVFNLLHDGPWIVGITSDTSVFFPSITPCTDYTFHVSVNCDNTNVNSDSLFFTSLGCGACTDFEYCEALGESTQFEWIQSVQIGDYLNESGDNGGYAQFEETEMVFSSGHAYPFVLTQGFAGTIYNEYFRIWLDINQNGEFEEEEMIFDAESAQSEALDTMILMPENMPEGFTRMRIAMKWNEAMESCGSFESGEVEDYCVTIDNTVDIPELEKKEYFSIQPNPANENTLINIANPGKGDIQIIDVSGKTVYLERANRSSISLAVDSWDAGIYIVQLIIDSKIIDSSVLIVSH